MYRPVRDGIEKNMRSVLYLEEEPPIHLSEIVHCFWELRTQTPLSEDFRYHILPDACVNILFDQSDPKITAITALQVEHKVLNLGKSFHYIGVQLLPGVWQGDPKELESDLVDKPYSGSLSLVKMNRELVSNQDFSTKQDTLSRFIEEFIEQKLVTANVIVSRILKNIAEIHNVVDMAKAVKLSPRQLQRKLKQSVFLSPHDFLKVLRIQQTFRQNYLDYYADQSHFIHSFRKITGYTPIKYNKKFDV